MALTGAHGIKHRVAAPTGVEPMAGLVGPQPGAASTPGRLAPTPIGTPVDILCFVAPAASPGLVLYATADYLDSYVMFATG